MSNLDLKILNQKLEDQGIKYLIPSYVDMHGVPKTKMVGDVLQSLHAG